MAIFGQKHLGRTITFLYGHIVKPPRHQFYSYSYFCQPAAILSLWLTLAHPGSSWLSQDLFGSLLLSGFAHGVIAWLQDFLQAGCHLKLISWPLSNFSACFNRIFQMSLIGAKNARIANTVQVTI